MCPHTSSSRVLRPGEWRPAMEGSGPERPTLVEFGNPRNRGMVLTAADKTCRNSARCIKFEPNNSASWKGGSSICQATKLPILNRAKQGYTISTTLDLTSIDAQGGKANYRCPTLAGVPSPILHRTGTGMHLKGHRSSTEERVSECCGKQGRRKGAKRNDK